MIGHRYKYERVFSGLEHFRVGTGRSTRIEVQEICETAVVAELRNGDGDPFDI